jgi:hypothetical protein
LGVNSVGTQQSFLIPMGCLFLLGGVALGQAQEPEPVTPQQEQAVQARGSTCLEPPPMVSWRDYNGPFAKLVYTVAGKVERRSLHQPHYKPGSMLCSFGVKDKFVLFLRDSTDPLTLLEDAFNSGIDQAQNTPSSFGQGMKGYGRRLGANVASDASGRFFSEFLFPTLLSEDPRYYRLGTGSVGRRLLHSLGHSVVSHRDSGASMPSISLWAGVTAGVLVSDVYHPGSTHGPGSIAWQVGSNVLQSAGFDVLREFWPELARKFHVPFRAARQPTERAVP